MNSFGAEKKKTHCLIITSLKIGVIILFISRFFLAGSGWFAFKDEFRYTKSVHLYDSFLDLDFGHSLTLVFSTQGRPFECLINLIPVGIQRFAKMLLNDESYWERFLLDSYVLFAWNMLVFGLIVLLLKKISSKLFADEAFPWWVVFLYLSTINASVYLRHSLPYDLSLLVFLFSVNLLLGWLYSDQFSSKRSFVLGCISSSVFLIYPGYFAVQFLLFCLISSYKFSRTSYLFSLISAFIIGSLSVFAVVEIISRVVGLSYAKIMYSLSSSITQGSFDESLVFVPLYLLEVEQYTSVFLLVGLLSSVYYVFRPSSDCPSTVKYIFIWLVVCVFGYSVLGYFSHVAVWYGRLWHQYMPFFCIISAVGIHKMLSNVSKKGLIVGVLLLCLSYFINYSNVFQIGYPRDFVGNFLSKQTVQCVSVKCEYNDSWPTIPSEVVCPSEKQSRFSVLNACYFYPVTQEPNIKDTKPLNVVEEKAHFLNYTPYQFEGFAPSERERLRSMNLKMKIIKIFP